MYLYVSIACYAVLFQIGFSRPKPGALQSQPVRQDESIMDITAINRELDHLFEGDILLTPSARNAYNNPTYLWDNAVVPITYAPSLNVESIAAIEDARTEFALKTCIDVKDRESEKHFINIESLNGCWSNIGKVGGGQTLSMGNGCHYKGTAIHELMHAIGFYHEQSRKDRDDYIKIELSNVIPDLAYNFFKRNILDNLREPYDLDSVVHYRDVTFSKDGFSKTIKTIDPELQDKILIRKHTLSKSDVTKINRLYKCGDTLLFSYHCDFDERTMCGWVIQNNTWSWIDLASPNFPVGELIPVMDGTHGSHFKGGYIYTTSNSYSVVNSMVFKSKRTNQCLQFWYYLDHSSGAEVNISISSVDTKTTEIKDKFGPIILDTQSAKIWRFQRKTISAPPEYRIIIEAKLNGKAALAIDDISIIDRPCDTAYFAFPSIKSQLAKAFTGYYIFSPVAEFGDGYGFYIRMYLNGTNVINQGQIIVYYDVRPVSNKPKPGWSYKNRYIRLSLMDQQSNPLEAQDQTMSFMDRERIQGISNLRGGRITPTEGLLNRRHFVKHDNLIISVEVKDMTPVVNQRTKSRQNETTTSSPESSAKTTTTLETTSKPYLSTTSQDRKEKLTTTITTQAVMFITKSKIYETFTYIPVYVTCPGLLFTENVEKTILYALGVVLFLLLTSLIMTCICLKRALAKSVKRRTKNAIHAGIASGIPKVEVFSVRKKEDKVRERVAEEVYLGNEYAPMMSIPSPVTPDRRSRENSTVNPKNL